MHKIKWKGVVWVFTPPTLSLWGMHILHSSQSSSFRKKDFPRVEKSTCCLPDLGGVSLTWNNKDHYDVSVSILTFRACGPSFQKHGFMNRTLWWLICWCWVSTAVRTKPGKGALQDPFCVACHSRPSDPLAISLICIRFHSAKPKLRLQLAP